MIARMMHHSTGTDGDFSHSLILCTKGRMQKNNSTSETPDTVDVELLSTHKGK
jgi:hypothetical protein